jgi:uncharacterized protein (TIGR03083 family)
MSDRKPTEQADPTDLWALISAERLRLADELAELTDQQWSTQSQCEHWTVRDVAAHLIAPFEVSTPAFLVHLVRSRFDIEATMRRMVTSITARRSNPEIIEILRANHDSRWTPPGSGPEGPLADIVVHGYDIRRPLGLDGEVPAATIETTLAGIDDADTRADYARRIGVGVPDSATS